MQRYIARKYPLTWVQIQAKKALALSPNFHAAAFSACDLSLFQTSARNQPNLIQLSRPQVSRKNAELKTHGPEKKLGLPQLPGNCIRHRDINVLFKRPSIL